MGNEASLEGEAGQPGAASASAPPHSGQLSEPSSIQGKPPHTDPINGPKPGGTAGSAPDQNHSPRKSPQGDAGGPKSPYSLPQIAPMPSSKLCPVCKTAELTGVTNGQPNCNTCTQCRTTVCNQCGFNPNPHLTEVQEWLCLNCQMQRALGMDMDTPRSKSQQQIHSPQQPTKPQPRTAPQTPSSTQPKPFPASQNELKSQSQPSTPLKTQTQVKPQPQPTPSTQARPPTQITPSAQTQARPQPQTTPSAQTQARPQSQTTPSLQTQAKPQPQTTPSPQTQAKPQSQTTPLPETQAKPQPQITPSAQTQAKPKSQPPTPSHTHPKLPSTPQTQRKSQSQPPTPTKSQPNPPLDQPFGKLFGFGASLLNQASSLISVDQQQPQSQPQTPQKAPTASPKPVSQPGTPSQQQKSRPKVCCPLCKTELNVGVPTEPPNYNHCTQCHAQVCNMCGFNPTPHLTEKKEWLCLTCQTQRAISGDLGDGPSPVPQPTGSPRAPGPAAQQQAQLRLPSQQAGVRHAGPQQQKTPGVQVSGPVPSTKQGTPQSKAPAQVSPAKAVPTQPASKSKAETRKQEQGISKKQTVLKTEKEGDLKGFHKKGMPEVKDQKKSSDLQKSKHHDDSIKSSTQSLSDTGYSSDGISGSQGEITGLIQEEGTKLSEGGLSTQRSPPSPSEIKKLESSMRPLLQSETESEIDKQRPQSLSITQDQFDSDGEVSDDLSCKLRHDYVEDSSESGLSPLPARHKLQKDLTDEEVMRRQILEMSADEEEMTEGHVKIKKGHKQSGDLGKEKRRLTQQSNSFEDDTKSNDGEGDDLMGSQGGLRRFKTIELNNTNSYNRDLELSTEHDLREPELEMESLTGSPEERSKGEYSSTLPATTPSYTSGTSPTSVSSLEDDSDSSPSRRQRLEEVKQQRKARHRSHGPLLPTIEDSSEEDELREEEELLKEQEKMRDLEQQRIRSTARKTKRDKEELRAQRRRERSKTPPSNLSPIEDASPTEELRQAAEMEELHRSSCSEYSPSMDSEAEGFEVGSKLYRSGSEYNLPTFMSLYSPTEKTSAASPSAVHKSLKSAEEVYEEMMRKAEMMQKQQEQGQQGTSHLVNNQHLRTASTSLSPGTSPTQMSAPVSFSESSTTVRGTARVNETQQTHPRLPNQTSKTAQSQPAPGQQQVRPAHCQGADSQTTLMSNLYSPLSASSPATPPSPSSTQNTSHAKAAHGSHIPQRTGAPRLSRQQSSQDTPVIVITLGSSSTTQPTKPITVNSSTSPLSSPTSCQQQPIYRAQSPVTSSPTSPQKSQLIYQRGQAAERVTTGPGSSSSAGSQSHRSENITLCKISSVPGTSKVIEQGTVTQSGNVVDLRAMKPAPIIMTDHGMDLTSLASDSRRYSVDVDQPPSRHTAVQPLIMNLNAQAQPYVATSTSTTVSVTVAASMFISQPKHPMVYGDPLQNRVDFGQGAGSAVCLSQPRPPITDPSIPKIDACLEDLGFQQQQLQKQQQKLQQQQELLEQQLQQYQHNTTSFARYNLANQMQPILLKKDLLVCQTSGGSTQTVVSAIPKVSPLPPQPITGSVSPTPTIGHDIYGGIALELKNKPTVANLSTGKPQVMMVQLDENSSQEGTVTQIVKREEPLQGQEVLDLTGQIKSENQVACCDVVYQLPFAGSCSGSFGQRGKTTISEPSLCAEPTLAPHQQTQPEKDGYQPVNVQGVSEEHKPFTMPQLGRLAPSMSDTNLAQSGLQYYQRTDHGDLAVDLSSMKQAYEAGYLGMGAQYGSYTDLRHQGEVSTPPLPLRKYGSMSNISGDFSYPSRDLAGSQEPNVAQYSATTAREISRMCAALNSMDQFGNRYMNSPDLLQFSAGRGGPIGRLGLQQGLTSLRANLLYGTDGRPTAHGQALTNLINARQASLRALYPPVLRTADGMIYSTINTPIASTLPITTQPAPVLNSVLRGVYRPYPPGNMTAVPLSSLSRLPQVTPRMPLSAQGPYRYPAPTHFPASAPDSNSGSVPTTSTSQDTPVYLGKPTVPMSISSTATLPSDTRATVQSSAVPVQSSILKQHTLQGHIPVDATTVLPHTQTQISQSIQQQIQAQTQPQSLTISRDLSFTQGLSPSETQAHMSVPQSQPHAATRVLPDTAVSGTINTSTDEKEKEEDRLRQQQGQLLQLERERIELEKLRQLRLQEELERDRLALQRHREKEQLIVQREIQELHTIKHQVLQQQQVERETQLVIQREQLAQQKMQLDQIQALQQQLQLQLQEQKRQKTAAVEAVASAAEAAAAPAAAAAAATTAQGAINGMVVGGAPQAISIICDQSGRVIQQDGQSLQFLPCMDGQMVQALVSTRPMPSSASEMSLRNSDDQGSSYVIKKQNSMPRLKNGTEEEPVKRIADSSVQTDDEDAEDRFMSRRRRTRRIADCSVQTDEEDQGEWDSQPVRRRRSRYSKHSESSAENKSDAAKVTSSIAIQTTNDSSCQTESDQLGRGSPAIHITMAETTKVELLHYISAPERTHKGESLACQTDPEAQSHGVVVPQLNVPNTVSPYSTSLQVVGATPAKFERRKPDPLDIGMQAQQTIDSRPPKSPHVLYSPVSPLSPHRMLETTLASSEKLNRAHVTPQQKTFTTESPKRHQTIPRPIKSVQRSMSDPKPLSPTSEDPSKTKFLLYQNQNSSSNQLQNSMMRKVKRTLPSPPPDESPLPIVTPAMTHMYSSPGMPQRVYPRSAQCVTKAGLLSDLKAVEQESSKLRKQQAELEEEEKEIDAKLRCLELGITQRKETMVKERERREMAYLRGIGDARDYMSDSELNNLRLTGVPTGAYEANGLLSRPSTAPLSHFTPDPNVTSQYPPTSSYVPYPFPQSQPAPPQQLTAAYQQIGFQTPQYPAPSQPQPGTFQPHPPQPPSYQMPQTQGPYQSHGYAQSYQPDLGPQQPSHPSFQPPTAHLSGQTLPYPSQSLPFQPQADMLSGHQMPRHTSLADLEQKLPTNYEIITNTAVSVATSAQETGFSGAYSSPLTNAYGPYRTPDQTMADHIPSPTSGYGTDGLYTTNLEQNIPRNYVMIDDISELTKESMGSSDASRTGYGGENGPRGLGYGDGSDDPYGRPGSTTSYHYQGAVDNHGRPSTTVSGGSSYYYDDYKYTSRSSSGMGSQKHSSKNLAPAAVSSKRSKHRKQGMEQKISKFSPIEEARDVESDLASYTMTTPSGGSCTMVSRSGVKKNVYDQHKYYGSREGLDEDDRLYNSGRSRSTGYGMDKISSRDSGGYRSKSYERDALERSQRGTQSRSGRTTMRTQNSEEESPLSPVGKPVGMGRDPQDVRNQYGSSHSLPDVQDHHIRDVPKSHAYKPDDPYLVDDMHCAVSDSEAYHLGQEETDWFEKPREAVSDRSRHHGSGNHSSSGKRSHVKHTYHDYDEPPEEDLWPQDEYNHQRHSSSTASREHRHHTSSSGRHSSSRHSSEEPRSSRSSRTHPKEPSARSEGRNTSSSSHKRSSEPRSSQSGYRDSGEYSHDPASGHHHSSSGQRGQRQSGASRRQESPSSKQQQQQQQQQQQGSVGQQQPPQQGQQRSIAHQAAGRQPGTQQPEAGLQGQQTSQQPRTQPQQPQQQQSQPHPGQQPAATTAGVTQPTTVAASIGPGASQQQAKPGQAPALGQPLAAGAPTAQPTTAGGGQMKPDTAPTAPTPAVAIGSKAAPQPAKAPMTPTTGIGSKAGPRPGGIGSAAQPTQQASDSENVFSKILPGGAAEQAGKLGDAVSAIGKKFTSFW